MYVYTEDDDRLFSAQIAAKEVFKDEMEEQKKMHNEIKILKNIIYSLKRKMAYAESTLPVKVGDTVYAYCEVMDAVMPYFVETLTISYLDEERRGYQFEANSVKDELIDSIDFEPSDIGKHVFLNKSDAEVCCMRNGGEEVNKR